MRKHKDWWLFHLTHSGWVAGTCKQEFTQKRYKDPPYDVVLTRRYYDNSGASAPLPAIGFEELDRLTQQIKELLSNFPYPDGFERFHEIVE